MTCFFELFVSPTWCSNLLWKVLSNVDGTSAEDGELFDQKLKQEDTNRQGTKLSSTPYMCLKQ